MSNFWKSFLTAFGMAAKDASPEELGAMVDATIPALDAEPAGKAQEAAPAADSGQEDERMDKKDREYFKSAIIEMLELCDATKIGIIYYFVLHLTKRSN